MIAAAHRRAGVRFRRGLRTSAFFATIDDAVQAAQKAFPIYAALPLAVRNRIIAAIRRTMLENATALARAAAEETKLGRFEDKILKNQLVAEKTPGTEATRAGVVHRRSRA